MKKFNKDKYLRRLKLKRMLSNNSRKIYIILLCLSCFIIGIYFAHSKFFVSEDQEIIRTTVGNFSQGDVIIGAYIDGEYSNTIPQNYDAYIVEKVVCDNDAVGTWNNNDWSITVKNLSKKSKCNIYFSYKTLFDYDYSGTENTFIANQTGTYKLEVWGAQGGTSLMDGSISSDVGGYGGYSSGTVVLNAGDSLYINVGGKGSPGVINGTASGGYNGGGTGTWDNNDDEASGGGGGATHIAKSSGLLSALENNKNDILIVAGGGGGRSWNYEVGSGGGIYGTATNGTSSKYPSQSTGFSFGQGQNGSGTGDSSGVAGGGGGYYGGYMNNATSKSSGTGGSGYIGNSLLTNKSMYCYNCIESSEYNAKTITTKCNEENPTAKCSKKGNGHARITYIADVNIEYYDAETNSVIVPNREEYEFINVSCANKSNLSWDEDNWFPIINSYEKNDTCKFYFKRTGYLFAYKDSEYEFIVPKSGIYRLEVWGAEGGNSIANGTLQQNAGQGGYSNGEVVLQSGEKLYINIGGKGEDGVLEQDDIQGGYNGGGLSHWDKSDDEASGGGGGATHIAKSSGLLSTLENNKDAILIVAGGGGGGSFASYGGSGGGYVGNSVSGSSAGSQTSGYQFGLGGPGVENINSPGGGGGSGYYGGSGGSRSEAAGSGGSGYIGNSLLNNKIMYCYNCTESQETATKTVSTTCSVETPNKNCAKKGNGYAKITYIKEN